MGSVSNAGGKGLVDVDRLARFMDTHGLAVGSPIELTRITKGHSNEVFKVERGDLVLALRRPPRVGYGPGAHDMVREYRVLSALGADPTRAVPVPRTYALCEDSEILGAPFFLMELLDGVVARDDFPAALVADGSPRQISFVLVDTLVAVHAFEWEAAGLGSLGRPAGFLQRQTDRWLGMIERVKVRQLPDIGEVAAWLRNHIPSVEQKPSLIHWDYRLDNVMFRPELPVRVRSVLDWEVATIGDPLIDLGWLLGMWKEPNDPLVAWPGNLPLHTTRGADDVPTRKELAHRYAEKTGRDVSHLAFYTVLGLFKLAALMEAAYARHVAGRGDDPLMASMEQRVPELARQALRFAD
jgi:aminoglycoside phosphotransferase (APT) family kinase protein